MGQGSNKEGQKDNICVIHRRWKHGDRKGSIGVLLQSGGGTWGLDLKGAGSDKDLQLAYLLP